MELVIAAVVIVAFDIAALMWGTDSRPREDAGQHRAI